MVDAISDRNAANGGDIYSDTAKMFAPGNKDCQKAGTAMDLGSVLAIGAKNIVVTASFVSDYGNAIVNGGSALGQIFSGKHTDAAVGAFLNMVAFQAAWDALTE
jgi:hypothetical protein